MRQFLSSFAAVLTFVMLSGLAQDAAAESENVRITDVNQSAPAQGGRIDVNPGDVVSLSADVVKMGAECTNENGCPENRPLEEFVWSSDAHPNQECNPGQDGDCLSNTGFQLHSNGVHFYVPYTMPEQIQVTVKDLKLPESSDTLSLHNARFSELPAAPTTVVNTSADYPYKTFSPNYALAGMGRWVTVEGEPTWVPYTHESEWVPYRHGYWTQVEGQGWTWVSYDPWGWYTDHYGIWRHHGTYGWVWLPFSDRVYRPATVTWFYTQGAVGWYPYYRGYPHGYRFGVASGFNDGFAVGLSPELVVHAPGFTVVANRDFLAPNIAAVHPMIIGRPGLRAAVIGEHLGPVEPRESRLWMETRLGGAKIPMTTVSTRLIGKTAFVQPIAIHPVPPRYQGVFVAQDLKRNVPVGSMVIKREGVVAPTVVLPTTNNRGIYHPRENIPVRARVLPMANPQHPYARRVEIQARKPSPPFKR